MVNVLDLSRALDLSLNSHPAVMNDDLTQRLLSAEGDLLVALQTGTQMLSSFDQTWSTLLDTLDTTPKTRIVGTETLSLADQVASRISIVSSCFLDLEREEESFTTLLQSDWDAMCRQLAALDLSKDSKSPQPDVRLASRRPPSHSRTLTPEMESSSLPFLVPAYRWLLDNLHNPYPTQEVKNRIATSSSCQLSSINSWFTNSRRRIGWTTLSRERFSTCKADMLDAAYRALVKEDPQRILSPELRHSFIAMKVAAENLYSSTFTRSAFTGDLVEEPIVGTSVKVGECPQPDRACPAKTLCDSYPSPDQSVSASPVPDLDSSLTDESEEEEDVVTPILAGSKRRRSSIDPIDPPSPANRPIKRLRTSKTSQTCLPSPPTSTDGTDIPSDNDLPESSPVQSVSPETNNRKRRLSDTDISGLPERPCGTMAPSRPYIVSDPQPHSDTNTDYSVDDWFNTNFDALFAMPPPVDAVQPDSSTLWDVELFRDYSIPGNSKLASSYAPAVADTHVSAPTGLPDLDDLLQSIEGETFATPSETVLPSDISGIPYVASLGSSMPDISQTSIDWTSLLNSTEAPQPTTYSTFLQYPIDSQSLPEIDLSMLQLPPVIPAANPRADLASKHAKLHQLHAMQDAVRRIEQELQSEGIIF